MKADPDILRDAKAQLEKRVGRGRRWDRRLSLLLDRIAAHQEQTRPHRRPMRVRRGA